MPEKKSKSAPEKSRRPKNTETKQKKTPVAANTRKKKTPAENGAVKPKRTAKSPSPKSGRKTPVSAKSRRQKAQAAGRRLNAVYAIAIAGILISIFSLVSACLLIRGHDRGSAAAVEKTVETPIEAEENVKAAESAPKKGAEDTPVESPVKKTENRVETPSAKAPAAETAKKPVVQSPPPTAPAAKTPETAKKPAKTETLAAPPAAVRTVPPEKPAAEPAKETVSPQETPSGGATGIRPAALPERPERHRGKIVFVIDDAGNNLRELQPFLRFPGAITIAVLPGLAHSAEAAKMIRAAGKEVFLHQPMEALGGQNPGPGGVYIGMTRDETRRIIRSNIAEIGPIAGMNNHQGSRVTEDRDMMETVIALCREQGIHFLDSRTTAQTAARAAANRLGVLIGERDIFIDNEPDRASMLRYIEEGLGKAERNGQVIMIGHTWSGGLAALLTELYPRLVDQGYTFSTVSELLEGKH